MNTGGEAAEQIVRMSLEGFEVAAKITGAGAKNIAILLYSILKEEQKTKGKARLTNMLRSGKELKVFTVRNSDLKKFTQEAKKYGVLYCVLADRKNKDPNAEVDVIARAEDASKISRIAERFKLASEATASVVTDVEKAKDEKAGQPEPDIGVQDKAEKDKLLDALMGTPIQKEENAPNPMESIRMFDNQDLCMLLQISKRTLQRYRSIGALPYKTLGKKTYYSEEDVLTFLSEHVKDFRKEDIAFYKARIHNFFNK